MIIWSRDMLTIKTMLPKIERNCFKTLFSMWLINVELMKISFIKSGVTIQSSMFCSMEKLIGEYWRRRRDWKVPGPVHLMRGRNDFLNFHYMDWIKGYKCERCSITVLKQIYFYLQCREYRSDFIQEQDFASADNPAGIVCTAKVKFQNWVNRNVYGSYRNAWTSPIRIRPVSSQIKRTTDM